MAHLKETPSEFLAKSLNMAFILSITFTFLLFMIFDKKNLPKFLLFPAFMILFFLFFKFNFLKIKGTIKKREGEINKEVLFIGHYLLIKLYSGRPLLNALIETSKSKALIAKSIKDIVNDIDTGNPIEKALDNALDYSPSEKFKKILFQINNALKLGIDVTTPLESVIEEISLEQENEIKRYGKKLNSLVIFYMLVAIVVPSIGMVLVIVLASFMNLPIGIREFILAGFFVAVMQFIFISLFRSIRPMVDL